MSITKPAFLIAPIVLLVGCSTAEGDFPSLERRPYESKEPIAAPSAPLAPPPSLPADLTAKVDTLVSRHIAAASIFASRLAAVQSTASRATGSAAGTESWVNAHVQLSRLDKARADSVAVVREFDSLIADAGAVDSTFVPLLTDAQKPVADDVAQQNAEISRLSRLIGE